MVAFVIAITIPWIIYAGPLRLSAYRIVLLVAFIPSLVTFASGKAGKIRICDAMIILYALWGFVPLAVNHGPNVALQTGGIAFIETLASYFLARCAIRGPADFYWMVKCLFMMIVCLLPFGIAELVAHRDFLLDLFRTFMPTLGDADMDPRWGLRRVQGPFDHPILFGVVCGSAFALTHRVLGYRRSVFARWWRTGVVAIATFLSLSAGPLTALFAQIGLMMWDHVLARFVWRWKLLWALMILMYIAISMVSNQSVPAFYLTHAPLFDAWTAYYRLLIWEYGSQTVLNHPIFGIGLNPYERPAWMPPSVDMFWLQNALTYGFPGVLLLMATFFVATWSIALRSHLSDQVNAYRTAYLIAMTSFFVVGWTVHFWNATYALFIFLLGSGVWILDSQAEDTQPTESKRRMRGNATVAHTSDGGIAQPPPASATAAPRPR